MRLLIRMKIVTMTAVLCMGSAFAGGAGDQTTIADGAKEAAQVCHETTCFPSRARVGDGELPARGVALFRYWGFNVYTMSLYAKPEHQGIDGVLADVPKRMVIHYHREIDRKDLIRSTREMIASNPDHDHEALHDRLRRLYAAYETVNAGDEYTIDYVPGSGTSISLNGVHQITIEGEDFSRAFFGIWLSDHPVSESLRDELLQTTKAG